MCEGQWSRTFASASNSHGHVTGSGHVGRFAHATREGRLVYATRARSVRAQSEGGARGGRRRARVHTHTHIRDR